MMLFKLFLVISPRENEKFNKIKHLIMELTGKGSIPANVSSVSLVKTESNSSISSKEKISLYSLILMPMSITDVGLMKFVHIM